MIARRAVVLTSVLMLAACAESVPDVTVDDRIDQTQAELIDDGFAPEVATCVVRLARHDLRRGPIDELVRDELLMSCERTQALLNGSDVDNNDSGSLAFVEGPFTFGDAPKLDALWQSCEEGSGAACDELFTEAPLGSDYERFGVSCGDRDDVLRCSELDEESVEASSP